MGVVALLGGSACTDVGANTSLSQRLLAASGSNSVLVLPTADAFEHPERAVATAQAWFAALGATATGLMVLSRRDASETRYADTVRASSFVLLVGDSPLHLRSTMKDTPVWEAICDVAQRGVLAAAGACAAAICDPMTDPRGGAFTLGLGLVSPLAVIGEAETWSADRLHRTHLLAKDLPVLTLPSGTAAIRTDGRWELVGDGAEVAGNLPV
jgi:cyanophycinase